MSLSEKLPKPGPKSNVQRSICVSTQYIDTQAQSVPRDCVDFSQIPTLSYTTLRKPALGLSSHVSVSLFFPPLLPFVFNQKASEDEEW